MTSTGMTTASGGPRIDPYMQMHQRVRALQAITYGDAGQDQASQGASDMKDAGEKPSDEVTGSDKSRTTNEVSLAAKAQRAQQQLLDFVKRDETLSNFLNNYNRDQAYLTPNFLFSGFVPSSESEDSYSKENGAVQSANISPEAQLSLLLEMQPIWRELAAQLEECSVLEKRNVLNIFETSTTSMGEDAASALPAMQERLQKFRVEEQAQTLKEFAGLEKRFTGFLASYTDYVDSMSQLFVQWDQALLDMERQVSKVELQHKRRQEAEAL